jgi:deoxyribodipyrimidine photo-lyase
MNIFIFHRDLRLHDNTTLIKQMKECETIVPIFIFTPEQIHKNDYKSNNSIQFMIETLHELSIEIEKYNGLLYFFYGDTIKILKSLHKEFKINSIGYNVDYTPYAISRDNSINKLCKQNDIKCYAEEDYALYDIMKGQTLNKTSGNAYLVFSPFKNYCLKNLKVREPDTFHAFNFTIFHKIKNNNYYIINSKIDTFYVKNPNINIHGGRRNGLNILKNIGNWDEYNKERDYLTYNTTFLSAHNHFSTISIREVYHRILNVLGKKNNLLNELHWRDFYINITYYYPHVLKGQVSGKNQALKIKYNKIKWTNNKTLFAKWCDGKTGFPIIDAAMNQLNTTGYMHNRCRMIVACFLTKDLLIDWRLGEKYFATKLVDYDPMSNSGGWQWASSTGADAQPYFRIFNPWSQQLKFDKECVYIKKWLPQLKNVDNKIIHKWNELWDDELYNKDIHYIKPIVEHDVQRKLALKLYH